MLAIFCMSSVVLAHGLVGITHYCVVYIHVLVCITMCTVCLSVCIFLRVGDPLPVAVGVQLGFFFSITMTTLIFIVHYTLHICASGGRWSIFMVVTADPVVVHS